MSERPPGARRALVIGRVTDDLPGVAASVHRLVALLRDEYRFAAPDTVVLLGADATLERIVAAFVALLRATRDGDAVVFYYAGHGGVLDVPQPGSLARVRERVLTTDLRRTRPGDFRGLLGSELSRWIDAIASSTANVIVILDCCGAADLVRLHDAGARHPCTLAFEAELKEIAREHAISRSSHDAGPRIALLLASTSGSQSYPDPHSDELLFSRLLCDELADRVSAARSTWDEIVLRVREQVRRRWPVQLPGVEGARFRFPFTTRVGRPAPEFYIGAVRGSRHVAVEAGPLAGIARDDRFEVVVHGWGVARRGHRIAVGEVDTIDAAGFTLRLTQIQRVLPAVVHVRRIQGPTHGPLYVEPRVELALSGWRPGAMWRRAPAEGATAHVVLAPGEAAVDVRDLDRELIARIELASADAAARLDAALDRAARWAQVWRSLHDTHVDPLGGFTASWGLLTAAGSAAQERLLAPGAAVSVSSDDLLFLALTNPGHEPRLYARAFRVRGDRAIEPWDDSSTGTAMAAGEKVYLGDTTLGPGRGIRPRWPERLPADAFGATGAREWAILVVSTHPIARTLLPTDLDHAHTRDGEPVYRTAYDGGDDRPRYSLLPVAYGLLAAPASA